MRDGDLEIAGQIVGRIFGRPATLPRVSGRGSCNSVFIAAVAGVERRVVRVNADRDGREFPKEAWCMAQAGMAGVSVPRPLDHGVVGGWNYSVQSFEGDGDGRDCEDQLPVWRWLGQAAARFHRVAVEGFGVTMLEEGQFDGGWPRYVGDNLRAVADRAESGWLTDGEASTLQRRFEGLAEARFRFGLCHGDLTPRNVVLDAGRGRMTLVDWGCAEAHIVPHFDFREVLRDHAPDSAEVSAFVAGYGMGDDGLRAALPEIGSLLLLCAFDLVSWARHCAPAQVAEKKGQLRNYLDRFQRCRFP